MLSSINDSVLPDIINSVYQTNVLEFTIVSGVLTFCWSTIKAKSNLTLRFLVFQS